MAKPIVSRRTAGSSPSKKSRATARKPSPAQVAAAQTALEGQRWRAIDRNVVSLQLCHAQAILDLMLGSDAAEEDLREAAAAALDFVINAKANVDGVDRRKPDVQS